MSALKYNPFFTCLNSKVQNDWIVNILIDNLYHKKMAWFVLDKIDWGNAMKHHLEYYFITYDLYTLSFMSV